jgi:hypothetical protein
LTARVVFFHSQDVITAVNNEGLYLAYGVIRNNEKVDNDTDNIKLATLVVAALAKNGLTVRWSGSAVNGNRNPIKFGNWRRAELS